ncbi:Hypothetical protein CINCED_3A021025 [Cinara cedri]|nr:Hypothetical protein CINCED_3A021025 [Cinara cedri]
MFIPPRYQYDNAPIKTILLYNNWNNWKVSVGQGGFVPNNCPVNRCVITTNRSEASNVDAIIFRNEFSHPGHKNTDKQVWIMLVTESAYYMKFDVDQSIVYWTATYRHDSDIVVPYGRWAYYNPSITQIGHLTRNYAKNKTKKVAMIVSNCHTDNDRLEYANELSKYISVDIYGKCGQFKTIKTNRIDRFIEMLDRDYKFYLAFENSNCIDYVTGQFFVKGLQYGMLPIVMGGRQEDYERIAPEKSYVHVGNFESPARLAEYLHRLDADDGLYNEYFRWKGTGEFIDTKFFCRLCAMLHDDGVRARGHRNFSDWWSGPGVCEQSVRPWTMAVDDAEDGEDDEVSSSQLDSSAGDDTDNDTDDENAD